MTGADFVTYALGGAAIAAAAVVVFGRNLFYNVLAFTAMLLATSGLFAVIGADFLAIVQIFVYVGGVVVLLLFGLMMTASEPGAPVPVDSRHTAIGGLAAAGLAVMALPAIASLGRSGPAAAGLAGGSAPVLGRLFLTDYALAFEAVGVVLLVAAVAAIVIVRWSEAV